MDAELRDVLEELEERMVTRMSGEIRASIQASEARVIEHVRASDEVLEQRMVTRMTGEIQASIQASEARVLEHAGTAVRTSEERTHRHMTVLIEGLRSDFRIATEAIAPFHRKVDALEEQGTHTRQRVDVLETRVAALERDSTPRRRRPK